MRQAVTRRPMLCVMSCIASLSRLRGRARSRRGHARRPPCTPRRCRPRTLRCCIASTISRLSCAEPRAQVRHRDTSVAIAPASSADAVVRHDEPVARRARRGPSPQPTLSETTTGSPKFIASFTTSPHVSCSFDGSTKRSAAAYAAGSSRLVQEAGDAHVRRLVARDRRLQLRPQRPVAGDRAASTAAAPHARERLDEHQRLLLLDQLARRTARPARRP